MRPVPGDAFLDPVGTGTLAAPPLRQARAGSALAVAGAPVAATLAALAIVAASGVSRRWDLPQAVEPWIYGYFADRYPLFAFALVYGLARIVAVSAGPGPGSVPRRAIFCALGVLAIAAAGLYPTFGGLILRGGFATGGMAFLTGQPLWLAHALGTFVSAAAFGVIVGAAVLAANRPLRPRLSRLGTAALAGLALWFGAALVGLGRDLGIGPWPGRAFGAAEAVLAACLLLAAALPHAALVLKAHRTA